MYCHDQSGRTCGAWYFCPKSYLNQKYDIRGGKQQEFSYFLLQNGMAYNVGEQHERVSTGYVTSLLNVYKLYISSLRT